MNNKFWCLFLLIFIMGCKEPEPRRPVQQKSGSFFRESVERSKQLLAKEEALIQSLIEKDSIHQYQSSPSGFWYFYENKSDGMAPPLSVDDEALIQYNLMSLSNDTIYSAEEIGIAQVKVDKSQLFPGLRNGLKVLREGEKATFLFPSSQAYGYKGDNNSIGSNVPLKSSVEVLKILKRSDSLNTNTDIP